MSTPDLWTTDTTSADRDAARAVIADRARVLTGAAVGTGMLAWMTEDLHGGWVLWTVFLLGCITSSALACAIDLARALWFLHRCGREVRR